MRSDSRGLTPLGYPFSLTKVKVTAKLRAEMHRNMASPEKGMQVTCRVERAGFLELPVKKTQS